MLRRVRNRQCYY